MMAAVDAVRERARRAASALDDAGIPCLVVGGNAVAAWVARVDTEAVRNTADVDILLRREDRERAIGALSSVGFVHRMVAGTDVFLDGPDGSNRSGVHVIFAGERVRPQHVVLAPDVAESEPGPDFPVPQLETLVRMRLASFRLEDRVQLLDLLDVGLIDESWAERLPPELGERLRDVVATRDAEA
jgi:hypothetical protein